MGVCTNSNFYTPGGDILPIYQLNTGDVVATAGGQATVASVLYADLPGDMVKVSALSQEEFDIVDVVVNGGQEILTQRGWVAARDITTRDALPTVVLHGDIWWYPGEDQAYLFATVRSVRPVALRTYDTGHTQYSDGASYACSTSDRFVEVALENEVGFVVNGLVLRSADTGAH